MALAEFVAKTRDAIYGPLPCAFWAADAVVHETGIDPITDLRGRDLGWAECRNMLHSAGGLLNLVTPRMDRLPGLEPLALDGVAVAMQDRRPICGVVLNGKLITRTATGYRIAHAGEYQVLRGWTCRRL